MSDQLVSIHGQGGGAAQTPAQPRIITPEERAAMREANEKHNAEVEKWAHEQRAKDILEGNAPVPPVTAIADMILKKLENNEIHDQAEREEAEERLLNGG